MIGGRPNRFVAWREETSAGFNTLVEAMNTLVEADAPRDARYRGQKSARFNALPRGS